jgi:catalase
VHSYSKDGAARFDFQKAEVPVYAPNSLGGAHADPQVAGDTGGWESDGELQRSAATLHPEDDDFGQAGTLVREVMDDEQRDRLVGNIVGHVSKVTRPELRQRVFEYWANVDPTLGLRVRQGVEPSAPGSNEDAETVGVSA